MSCEIREGGSDRISDEDKIDGLVYVARANSKRQSEFGKRQLFISHPASDFDDLVEAGADIT